MVPDPRLPIGKLDSRAFAVEHGVAGRCRQRPEYRGADEEVDLSRAQRRDDLVPHKVGDEAIVPGEALDRSVKVALSSQ